MKRRPQPEGDSHATGVAGAAVMVIFGIVWTVIAFVITRNAPMPGMGKIFPFFGIVFVGFGLYQFRQQLKRRELEALPPEERRVREAQSRGINRFAANIVAFLFALGWTAAVRSMPFPIVGKLFMLFGLVLMFFTGRAIYRQIRDWVQNGG